jgi:hypothetical protein
MSDKQLLPSKDYVNAKNIALYVNSELSGEKNILKPDKADNLFDMSIKFEEERNASAKFCLYGKIESKWGDCNNLKVDFKIVDSSTNLGTGLINNNYPFWLYDKNSGASATSWSFISKSLDFSNGDLSKNIYGKKKGQYFFPFELDLNSITNSNKSIYIKINDIVNSLYYEQEFPFLYFNEESKVLEYGSEIAEILDDGNIIEINNNYPFFYDRHWIRRELEPTGPPFVYFPQSSLTFTEGDPNQPDFINNKIIQFDVALNKPPRGVERIKLSVVYGLDENFNEYTNVAVPQDVVFNFSNIDWNSVTANTVQTISIKLNDDFYVEKLERLTLQIVPILGVLPDPEKAQMMSIYIQDNDIPSTVTFNSQSYQFIEPRQDIQPLVIPITLNLDRKLLVPNQSLELYIDDTETDCLSRFGFLDPNSTVYTNSYKFEFNQTDLSYATNFYFISKRSDDLQTKITLRLRNFTSNVVPGNLNQSNDNKFVLYVDKNIDKNYVQINIPFDKQSGKAVLRSVFNKPLDPNSYNNFGSYKDYITKLQTFDGSSFGNILANTLIAGNTQLYKFRDLVFEDFFKINIKNLGERIIFDGHTYDNGDTLSLNVYSGFSTSVSNGQFLYDGTQFILKLPANSKFVNFEGFPGILGSNILGLNLSGASIWGFQKVNYQIEIQNQTYNYIPSVSPTNDDFKTTNLLTSKIYNGIFTNNDYKFEESFSAIAGNDNNKKIYYTTTQLENLNTQIEFKTEKINGEISTTNEVAHYSAPYSFGSTKPNNMYFSPNKIYYPGIVIIPKGSVLPAAFSPPDDASTSAKIFLNKDVVGIENDFNRASTTNPNILSFPCSDYTIPLDPNAILNTNTFDFGQLIVQAGYYSRTITTSTYISTDDSFVAATKYFSSNTPSAIKNGFLYTWSQANINTKNQAVIEIVNEGVIPVKILDTIINPNEKLWLSEHAISTNNSGGLVKNIVTPLDQLKLILPTNYNFLRNSNNFTINKFTQSKYKVSFLNFVLYNESNGLPSNKTVNRSFLTEINAVIGVNGSAPSYPLSKFYLTSIYSPHVLVNYRTFAGYVCDPLILGTRLLSDLNPSRKFIVHGFIASASLNSPLSAIRFSHIPVNSRGASCSDNGITWVNSNYYWD